MEQKLTPLKDVIGKENECWLALDRVRDPGNLGTIIRTADALGAKGVLLVGETTDPFALEAVRATMGSLFHMKLARANVDEFLSLAGQWKTSGGQVIGTHLKGAVDHRSIDYTKGPQLLLMGNEQQGLTDELADACSKLALISMGGAADSLNLAVATGIMLFEARRHSLKQIGEST
jgi:TrmH family RNA methyltransferase